MKQHNWIIASFMALLIIGCTQNTIHTYDEGISQMQSIQQKYQADFEQAPIKEAIPSLISELKSLNGKIINNEDTKALELIIDYRIGMLESDYLVLEGFKWGDASTTKSGFGCRKGGERILNSTSLRLLSAQKGFDSIETLTTFIDSYPKKAFALNLTQRTIVSLNANYFVVQKEAQKDKDTVEGFCRGKITISKVDGGYRVSEIEGAEE